MRRRIKGIPMNGRSTSSLLAERLGLWSVACVCAVAMTASAAYAQGLNRLEHVEVKETDKATEIIVTGSHPPTFTVFKLSDPTRLFIDVSNADVSSVAGPVEVDNGVVTEVTPIQFNDDLVSVGRVIVGLKVDALYSVRARGNKLVIRIDGSLRSRRSPTVVSARPGRAGASAALARARAAEARATRAEARADAAERKAQAAEASRSEAEALEARVQVAEARAEAAEARGGLAVEAEARAQQAEEQAEALEVQIKVVEARAEAAEAQIAIAEAAGRKADQAEARAEALQARAELAEAKAARLNVVEARAAAAEARARALEAQAKSAKAADRQAKEAIARAERAESRALAAESMATKASADSDVRIAASEARLRAAMDANEAATARAGAAEARADQSESRAVVAEQNAARAGATAAERTAAVKAQAESERQAKQAALARAAAAEAQGREVIAATRRVAAAESRAEEAEARARAAEGAAEQLSLSAAGRATAAEARARALAEEKAAVEARAVAAEASLREVRAAEARAVQASKRAERIVRERRSDQAGVAARAEAAEAKARVAEVRARNAERATKEAHAALKRAEAAEAALLASKADKGNARRLKLAEQRAAVARQELATAKTRVRNAESRAAKAERRTAKVTRQYTAAKTRADGAEARAASAEERANEAGRQHGAAQARITALEASLVESKRTSEATEGRAQALEVQVEQAKHAKKDDEAIRLQAELDTLRAQVVGQRVALAAQEEEARQARGEASRLQAALTRAEHAEQAAQAANVKPAPAIAAPVSPAAPAVADAGPKTQITNVRFNDTPESSVVEITFSGRADYDLKREGERTRILEFRYAQIDGALERSLDTGAFGGAVQLVSSFQAPPPGDRVRVVVTLGQQVIDRVAVNGNVLTWRFDKPAQASRAVASQVPPAPAWAPQQVAYGRPEAAVYTGQAATVQIARLRPTKRVARYRGRKINIDIKDGDIHNVLRLLAKEGNINIVTSDEVTGTVTLHLKQVPWDQALDIILRAKALGMDRDGDIIVVAPAAVLANERKMEAARRKSKQLLRPLEVRVITISHSSAQGLVAQVLPVLSSRGFATMDQRTNTIIVRDVEEHLDAAEEIIRRLDTQTPQVLIEARIVEVNTNSRQQFGIQWGGDAMLSPATGNSTGLRFPSAIGIAGGADDAESPNEGTSANPNYVVNLPAAAGTGQGGAIGFTFGSIDSTFNLNVRLSAMESQGAVKLVSSPRITTLDNKKASIRQGRKIPFSQVSATGVQTVFVNAELKLEVTPHVTQDGNIYLQIKATNNTPDFQNVSARGDPTILTKEAQTELLLQDGDTTVIGGIYTSSSGVGSSSVPFLSKLPLIGVFFRTNFESEERSELLIFVTPRIVNRAASTIRSAE